MVNGKGEEAAPFFRKTLQVPLARVLTSGVQNLTTSPKAYVVNPSKRISLHLSVGFEADDGSMNLTYSGTVTVKARRFNPYTGRWADGHTLLSARAAPTGWELNSSIKLLSVECASLAIPTKGGSNVAGQWTLLCEWEADERSAELLQFCGAELAGDVATLRP